MQESNSKDIADKYDKIANWWNLALKVDRHNFRMIIPFNIFLVFWLILFPLSQVLFARTSPLEIDVSEFHSRKSNLLDSTLPVYEIYSEAEIRDSTFLENPRLKIFRNVWCWSERDDTPRCTTHIILGAERISITDGYLPTTNDEGYENYKARFDKEILQTLRKHANRVEMIELLRYEETGRASAIIEGLMYTQGVFAVAALLELIASNVSSRGYNWSYVGIPSAGFFLTFSAYRFITMDPSPTLSIIKIKF